MSSPPRKRPRSISPSPPSPLLHSLRPSLHVNKPRSGRECPYMHTINQKALDFDLPPVCSVTLQSQNLYICLVCGRYLHGRSPQTPAFHHALNEDHHLFINYATETVYCLPDQYRVIDPVLHRIAAVLRPTFCPQDLLTLHNPPITFKLPSGVRTRGLVPLHRFHTTDYANPILHLILRVAPVRDFLLLRPAEPGPHHPLLLPLSELARKMWAPVAFRDHISPHHITHLIARYSKSLFSIDRTADPATFLAWLLNTFHSAKSSKDSLSFSQLVTHAFRGLMRLSTGSEEGGYKTADSPFWFLSLDLPPKPLFKDQSANAMVAQLPLTSLLDKFDGRTTQHIVKTGQKRTYTLLELPQYLVLVIRRFTKSNFGIQKNPCVVHLPTDHLDMSGLCPESGKYSLVAAVLHSGSPKDGRYRVVVRHYASNDWYDLADMKAQPTLFQMISLDDTYMLLYETIDSDPAN